MLLHNMNHEFYLKQALKQAKKGKGFCAPNPAVGALIVKNGQIIAEGYHKRSGEDHAEVDALKKAGCAAKGASLYVTLEPCCHWGKTPPCVDAIKTAGIKQVYYAYTDPNKLVNHAGAQKLQEYGIETQKILLSQIDEFYRSYAYWLRTHLPFVTIKIAQSLDGKIAERDNRPIQITGKEVQIFTHKKRKQSDGILTTINTLLHDNPAFNVRLPDQEIIKKPLFILDSDLQLPQHLNVFQTTVSITVFHSDDVEKNRIVALEKAGVQCVAVERDSKGKLDLQEVLTVIGSFGIHDLWVEVGAACFHSFVVDRKVQKIYICIAPKFLGSDKKNLFQESWNASYQASRIKYRKLGPDICLMIDLEK